MLITDGIRFPSKDETTEKFMTKDSSQEKFTGSQGPSLDLNVDVNLSKLIVVAISQIPIELYVCNTVQFAMRFSLTALLS